MTSKKKTEIDKARDSLDELSRQQIEGKITTKEFNLFKLPYLEVLGTRGWYNDDGSLKL